METTLTDLTDSVCTHYQAAIRDRSAVLAKITELLGAMGAGPLTADRLAGLDQFHFGGLAATIEVARRAKVAEGARVLDAGSGLGGPSRYLAETFACDVTGVDLAPDYVAIAQLLADRAGLADRVRYEAADVARLPFDGASFDLIWTQHVVMNIRDRDGLYREFRRVLKPGGKLAFYDVLAVEGAEPAHFPVPWAATPDTSLLLTETETRRTLVAAGFDVVHWDDVTRDAFAWMARQQVAGPSAAGPGPGFIVGERMGEMVSNFARNLKEKRTQLVIGVCEVAS